MPKASVTMPTSRNATRNPTPVLAACAEIKTTRAAPIVPPVERNIPRRPLIAAIRSGASSIAALLSAGLTMPKANPAPP